jgi:sialate O-acetylesterase
MTTDRRWGARPQLRACWCFLFGLTAAVSAAQLDPTLDAWFGDGMVMQADRPIVVRGRIKTAGTVAVRLGDSQATTTADAAGGWSIELPARTASWDPVDLRVETGGRTITRSGIRIGEVWICGGQSNMVFNVGQHHADASKDSIGSGKIAYWSSRGWRDAEADTAKVPFTPLCFGRRLVAGRDVPVGLVPIGAGGTSVLQWLPRADAAADPATAPLLALVEARRAQQLAGSVKDLGRGRWEFAAPDPSLGLIDHQRVPRGPDRIGAPDNLLPPFAVRGVIWWQGEEDQGMGLAYEHPMRCLIRSWRRQLGRDDLPFLFVQLPAYTSKAGGGGINTIIPWLREAQRRCLAEPATAMATTLDLHAEGGIHPLNKDAYAQRLLLLAHAFAYGEGNRADAQGPHPVGQQITAQGIEIRYQGVGDGLKTSSAGGPPGFELAGDDRQFLPAQARISAADRILVHAAGIAVPKYVRYAFAANPVVDLTGSDLPAVPFASDLIPLPLAP